MGNAVNDQRRRRRKVRELAGGATPKVRPRTVIGGTCGTNRTCGSNRHKSDESPRVPSVAARQYVPALPTLTEPGALPLVARAKSRFRRRRRFREAGRKSKQYDMSRPAMDLPIRSLRLRGLHRARRAVVSQVGAPGHGPSLR